MALFNYNQSVGLKELGEFYLHEDTMGELYTGRVTLPADTYRLVIASRGYNYLVQLFNTSITAGTCPGVQPSYTLNPQQATCAAVVNTSKTTFYIHSTYIPISR